MAFPARNTQWAGVTAQMVNSSTGAAFVGTVTCYVDGDNTGQVIGSVGAGICTSVGNGAYVYVPAIAETNYTIIAFTFTGTGAIPQTISIPTITAAQSASLLGGTGATAKTVRQLITAALLRINVIQSNQTPNAEDMTCAFDRFNDWVDSVCGNDRLAMFSISSTTWTINSGTFTIGPSAQINIPARPQYIDRVTFIDPAQTPSIERPLIMLTDAAYQSIPIKTLTSTYPTYAYYNPTYVTGYGTLSLWLVPTLTLTGTLYYPLQVTSFPSIDSTISLPPGYNRFMRDNLAVELAEEFRENVPIDPGLVRSAAESKANIKRLNIRMMDMSIDPAIIWRGGTRSNIYTGP